MTTTVIKAVNYTTPQAAYEYFIADVEQVAIIKKGIIYSNHPSAWNWRLSFNAFHNSGADSNSD